MLVGLADLVGSKCSPILSVLRLASLSKLQLLSILRLQTSRRATHATPKSSHCVQSFHRRLPAPRVFRGPRKRASNTHRGPSWPRPAHSHSSCKCPVHHRCHKPSGRHDDISRSLAVVVLLSRSRLRKGVGVCARCEAVADRVCVRVLTTNGDAGNAAVKAAEVECGSGGLLFLAGSGSERTHETEAMLCLQPECIFEILHQPRATSEPISRPTRSALALDLGLKLMCPCHVHQALTCLVPERGVLVDL